MDYSSWKKIFFILIIIILILNICTKVFADFTFNENGQDVVLPDLPNPAGYTDFAIATYNGNYDIVYFSDISYVYYYDNFIMMKQVKTATYHQYRFIPGNSTWNDWGETSAIDNAYALYSNPNSNNCLRYSTFDVKDKNGNIIFKGTPQVKMPEIANSLSDLESLNFDVVSVNAWDWSNKEFDILFYDRNIKDTNTTEGLYPKRVITLDKNTSYYQSDLTADSDKNAIYWIPIDEIGLNFYIGGNYEIRLAERVPLDSPQSGADFYYNYLGDSVRFTISSDVSQDKINAINKEIEDTTNKKYHDETINKMNSINNNINNVNDALTNTTPNSSVSSDINNSLNFDNQNEGLNNLNGGFFSRLTTMLSNLLGYNLADDTSVSIPFPNSEKHLILHSKDIYDHVVGPIRIIINAFWIYIFSFYMWKFINKIYIAISTGNILDSFSSSGEAITNNML